MSNCHKRRKRQQTSTLNFSPSPSGYSDELVNPHKKRKNSLTSSLIRKRIIPPTTLATCRLSLVSTDSSLRIKSLKMEDTVLLDSSSELEVIDASVHEIPSEFDWIKTPRSTRSRLKLTNQGETLDQASCRLSPKSNVSVDTSSRVGKDFNPSSAAGAVPAERKAADRKFFRSRHDENNSLFTKSKQSMKLSDRQKRSILNFCGRPPKNSIAGRKLINDEKPPSVDTVPIAPSCPLNNFAQLSKWTSAANIKSPSMAQSPLQNLLGDNKRRSSSLRKAAAMAKSPMQTLLATNNRKSESLIQPALTNAPSPSLNLLGGSKLRNVEAWLAVSVAHPPVTPPMSLSPRRRRVPPRTPADSPSQLDPEVREVLMAVYGDDWQDKAYKKSQTDVKKSRRKLPGAATDSKVGPNKKTVKPTNVDKNTGDGNTGSTSGPKDVRRNIFADNSPMGAAKTTCSGALKLDIDCTPSPARGVNIPALQNSNAKMQAKKKRRRMISTSSVESNGVRRKSTVTSPLTGVNDKLRSTPCRTRSTSTKVFDDASAAKTPRRTFLASLSVSTPNSLGHPDAQTYKIHFAKKKDELCSRLFKLYNSEVFGNQLPLDLEIKWNPKMRGTAGFCYNKKKKTREGIVRRARLELAPRVVDRADRLRDTLIHELCHAAAWLIDGVLDGHGQVWSKWADCAMARFPELPTIRRCHSYKIATKYTYRCTGCGYSINRQSRSIDTERKRCGHCLGVLELLFNKKKRGKTEAPEFETTRTLRAPNSFALFVKENYKRIKESQPGKKHGEVMKLVSQEYAVFKSVVTPFKK